MSRNGMILNRYQIVKRLGQGASGMVFHCKDTELGNLNVAIKVLPG